MNESTRRQFLKSLGVGAASMPFLMGLPSLAATMADPKRKQRLVIIFSPDGIVPEIVELKGHPWFIGVQFNPELKSRPFEPHPLFTSFVGAALEKSRLM